MTSKMKFKQIVVLGIIIAVLAGAIFLVVNFNSITTKSVENKELEQERYGDWLAEECECLERGKLTCMDGFSLIGNLCRNSTAKLFTYPRAECSKYNCTTNETNEIVNWTGEEWRKET